MAEPSRGWSVVERDAWGEVLAIADATAPFSFTEIEPLVTGARATVEAVACRLHHGSGSAWAQANARCGCDSDANDETGVR
jgi:hypothetical protein